jgi:hypothetical protein
MTRDDSQGRTSGSKDASKPRDLQSWKPGSEGEAAKDVGGAGDFGVPVNTSHVRDRDYVSQNTKRSDPGAAQPRSSEFDGRRTAGAGAPFSGDGSGSGGDLDPDVIGVGTRGSGVAASGPRGQPGPDDSDGTSNEMASGGPAKGRNQAGVHHVGGDKRVHGSTISRDPDIATAPITQGADAVTNPFNLEQGDAFAGEVSMGEARGQDLSMPPSQDTQGLSTEDNQAYPQKRFPDDVGGDDDTATDDTAR